MTIKTSKALLERMVQLAKMPYGERPNAPWVMADMIHQEQLFALQEAMLEVIADLARGLGPASEAYLVAALPHCFSATEVRS